jgi:hypothetical protein
MKTFRFILIFAAALTQFMNAQNKGDFFICYGFEFPSGGYISLRYYPVEKIGAEIYTSAFYTVFNFGARMNIHTSSALPHTFISIGYSSMTVYNPFGAVDTTGGRSYFIKRWMSDVDLGVGREVEYDFKHFSFQLGPTYILKTEDTFYNDTMRDETVEASPVFSYFFVATMLAHLPEKNPQPIRLN